MILNDTNYNIKKFNLALIVRLKKFKFCKGTTCSSTVFKMLLVKMIISLPFN